MKLGNAIPILVSVRRLLSDRSQKPFASRLKLRAASESKKQISELFASF